MKKISLVILFGIQIFGLRAQSIEAYIESNAFQAQYLMQNYGLPASIVLGVAIHESAAGKSKIARYLNNHFGIKGPNSSSQIKSAYRGYPSVDSSYNHFVAFLKSRPYFNILFEKYNLYDYKSWARGIQRGGYAASRTWAAQVIGIIQKYELFKYDNRPEGYQEGADSYIPVSPSATSPKLRSYLVKSGDNLGRIAKRFQTTVKALMQKNGLKTTAIKPGLKLKL